MIKIRFLKKYWNFEINIIAEIKPFSLIYIYIYIMNRGWKSPNSVDVYNLIYMAVDFLKVNLRIGEKVSRGSSERGLSVSKALEVFIKVARSILFCRRTKGERTREINLKQTLISNICIYLFFNKLHLIVICKLPT